VEREVDVAVGEEEAVEEAAEAVGVEGVEVRHELRELMTGGKEREATNDMIPIFLLLVLLRCFITCVRDL
jgi:hypothetical protein